MPDFLGMMKQAAQLQSKMQAMQEELGHVEVEGISGGGMVAVRMTAKMEVKGIKIDPSLMKADEREILEDLLVTAHNDARRQAEAAGQRLHLFLHRGLRLAPRIVEGGDQQVLQHFALLGLHQRWIDPDRLHFHLA